jgi:hypothetical protein
MGLIDGPRPPVWADTHTPTEHICNSTHKKKEEGKESTKVIIKAINDAKIYTFHFLR